MAKREVISRFLNRHWVFSNFYPAIVVFENEDYPTAEHAFQAAKTLDPIVRRRISRAATPGIAKRIGQSVELRPMWDDIKLDVMKMILRSKFEDSELREDLLATGDAVLIEGNTWGDRFWGACIGPDATLPRWDDGSGYIYGENHLGHLLMELRDELRGET